jgi:hypothetical protein
VRERYRIRKQTTWTRADILLVCIATPFCLGIGALIGIGTGIGWRWGMAGGVAVVAQIVIEIVITLARNRRRPW